MASFEKNLSKVSNNHDLMTYFVSHYSVSEKIGIEVEMGIVDPKTGISISFQSVEKILKGIQNQNVQRWSNIIEDDCLIGLKGIDGACITLEMGCGIEYSSRPFEKISDLIEEMRKDISSIAAVVESKGWVLIAVAVMPFDTEEDTSWIPKKRGVIQKKYFSTLGEDSFYAWRVMSQIFSTQVNFDYTSEQDLVKKVRVLVASSPIFAALYVNSPIAEGRLQNSLSTRLKYWQKCDPMRCGCLQPALDKAFSLKNYIDWAIEIPLMFRVHRDGTYATTSSSTPFSKVLRNGFADGQRTTMQDWSVHLSSIITDVRLKNVIEFRVIDAPPYEVIPSIPILLTGIIYHPPSLQAVENLFDSLTVQQYQQAIIDVTNRGLDVIYNGSPIKELARELIDKAKDGLNARIYSGVENETIISFLEPIEEIIESGISLADSMIESWHGELNYSPQKFVEKYRIKP